MLIKANGIGVYIISVAGYFNVPFMGNFKQHSPTQLKVNMKFEGTYAASKKLLELAAETV